MRTRLGVNVDHVATIRQARDTRYPDPVTAAAIAELAGADQITIHLREDRRHIQDRDLRLLRETIQTRMNLEMAATPEMLAIALEMRPDSVTLVPERREEQTTEGGLDVVSHLASITSYCERLMEADMATSLFIDPDREQVEASSEAGVVALVLHVDQAAQDVALVVLVANAQRQQLVEVLGGFAEPVDARDRRHHDHVATGEQS